MPDPATAQGGQGAFDGLGAKVDRALDRYLNFVLPAARRPLFFMGIAIIFLAIYRFGLGGGPWTVGMLPGDLYYSTSGFSVSCPIVSCMVISWLFNSLARSLR
mmetsp:Transcript_12942/g.19107  ORF Transcript_12942/g.19107 Transcript_12942/m.19107 type:complete len:103 (-) Transcript_12942:240-548(-)